MADAGLEIVGLDQMISKLSRIAGWMGGEGAARALEAEAELEMTEAKRRTPVKTGNLKGSGLVHPAQRSGDVWSVVMSFGNAAVTYALKVHEDVNAFHRSGQAKFLESVLLESVPYLAQRVAARLRVVDADRFAPSRTELKASRAAQGRLETLLEEGE
jgi:hypothetical protein